MSTKMDKMAKKERSGESKKMVLKVLNHRKSSLIFAFFLALTHTHAHTHLHTQARKHQSDDTTQESDGCRKEDVCLELPSS